MGQFSIIGSRSMEISNLRFTGLFSEGIELLDFKPCLMKGLIMDIMTSETHLNGTCLTSDILKSTDIIISLLFRFVFIPFIQREVDAWVHQ